MRKLLLVLPILSLFLNFGCVPPKEEVLTEINMNLQDSVLQQIYTFQDERNVDSLTTLFRHADPTYRYASAMAMASIRDKSTTQQLATLLADPVEEVRMAAAYAIGQIGEKTGESLLIQGFDGADTLGLYKRSNSTILEAIGRCGTDKSLGFLSTIKTYTSRDTALLQGQTYGIYRFATRKITTPEGTNRMVGFVGNNEIPTPTRVIAANYLYRAKDIQLDSIQVSKLSKILETEKNADIRMTLAIALGKTKMSPALKALTSQFAKEQDNRVKCNILRALGNFPYADMQGRFFETIKNPNTKLALTASDFFVNHGEARDAQVYLRRARELENWPVKINMYKAANRHMPAAYEDNKWRINNDLKLIVQDSTNNLYQRTAALEALGEYAWNYKFLNRQALESKHPAMRTAALDGLAKICNHPDFDRVFNVSKKRVKRELSVYLADLMSKGDAGVKGIVAGILSADNDIRTLYDNNSFLHIAKRSLELPKETEALYALEKAIALFEGKDASTPKRPDYNHPIDWTLLEGVTTASKATIKTNRGSFTIQLYPLDAPASVANFIKLATDGFYNDKAVHRVVPNFVMQAGCPRGDGYGGLDYTLRTEVPLRHYDQEGYVGMASAGPDTEGTQWFVTHSPTPHLDGNYTIFAKVTEGMNVVHDIYIGDIIESVSLDL